MQLLSLMKSSDDQSVLLFSKTANWKSAVGMITFHVLELAN